MRFNRFIRRVIHLRLDQFIHYAAQVDKTLGTFLCGITEIRLHHDRVLPKIHFTVNNCEGIVFHRRISRNGFLLRYIIPDVR